MKTYTINIDRKTSVWVNEEIEVPFEGTEEELREAIEQNKGNIYEMTEFGSGKNVIVRDYEHIIGTEIHLDDYEIRNIEVSD
jgi:UDP-N-acetylenolpyruvoylglucosamine reductase